MKAFLLTLVLFCFSINSYAQSHQYADFIISFKRLKLDQKYDVNGYLKPTYLQADFNKDGHSDIALPVIEKNTKRKGILLIHGRSNQYFVFGAGTNFGNGGSDFKWSRGWKLYNRRFAFETTVNKDGDLTASRKVKLNQSAIFIYNGEGNESNSGGIIYWDGKKYIWIQQGE